MISGVATDPDVLAEAHRLLEAAARRRITIRLVGGAAILLRSSDVTSPGLARVVPDIDLVTPAKQRFALSDLLAANGYVADAEFNAFHGMRRLLFYDRPRGRQIDVFVGEFAMCHVIPLAGRLDQDPESLPLAELALTKLQIVKLNQKDLTDLYRLFLSHDVGDADAETINLSRIASLCSNDWGLERTLTINLERLNAGLAAFGLSDVEQGRIRGRLARLADAVRGHSKSTRWKLRAVVGERLQWYEDPDEP